ncbi:MAG: tripartite tricarboxylate transporter TctB family protein [Desulfobacterales bacterium]|nr:tripartite tricarboxylate transporter TctB family protein [Desulfobacterales bacterium]
MKQFFKKGNSTDIIIGFILFMISFPFLLNMHHFVSGGTHSAVSPLSFPRFVMVLVVILSLVLMVTGFLSKPTADPQAKEKASAPVNQVNTLIYLGLLFLYLILLHYVGFVIATPIIMVAVAYILNGRNFKVMIPGFIAFSVILYYVALKLMKIMLPLGIFFE